MRNLALIAMSLIAMATQAARAAEPCALPQLVATIPFAVDEKARPFLPVTLEGKETRLLLGTGQAWSLLRKGTVELFGIRTVNLNAPTIGAQAAYGTSLARVSDFRLGGIPFGSKVDFLIDGRASGKPFDKDGGILGLNLLTRYDLELDNAGKTVSLFSEDHCSGAGVHWADEALTLSINKRRPERYMGTEIRAKNPDNEVILPIARVMIAGREANALLDTTSEQTIVDTFLAREYLGVKPAPPFTHTFESFTVSGMEFTNMPAQLVDLEGVDIVLGMNELKKLRIYFAFKDGMIHITGADAGRTPQQR